MTDNIEARIMKLLAMAQGMANENESANALQLAQKLADAHNLELGTIGKTGKREDKKVSKGLYPYQRTLYNGLADLSHCRCWLEKGLARGQAYQIRLLGSKVNVAVVQNMADYLEKAVNHMVRDRFGNDPKRYFSKDANAYRTGMVDTLVSRVRDKREAEEAERRAANEARHSSGHTAGALVLIEDVSKAEEKANYDFLYGEGAWDAAEARMAARREEREEAQRKHAAWLAAHPEEAAKIEAEAAAAAAKAAKIYERNERNREKARQARIDAHEYDPKDYQRGKPSVYDNDAYWTGRNDGDTVGLEEQIDEEQRLALGGRA